MTVKYSARRYDIVDAAKMANEHADVEVQTGPDLIKFKWTWSEFVHELSVNADEDEEFILQSLFRAAIRMAKM